MSQHLADIDQLLIENRHFLNTETSCIIPNYFGVKNAFYFANIFQSNIQEIPHETCLLAQSLFDLFEKYCIFDDDKFFEGMKNSIYDIESPENCKKLCMWLRLLKNINTYNIEYQKRTQNFVNFLWYILPLLLYQFPDPKTLDYKDSQKRFYIKTFKMYNILNTIHGNIIYNSKDYNADIYICEHIEKLAVYFENEAISEDKMSTRDIFFWLKFIAGFVMTLRMFDDPNTKDKTIRSIARTWLHTQLIFLQHQCGFFHGMPTL